MVYTPKTYDVVLECRSCSVRFEVANITFENVRWLPFITVCPKCGAASHASGTAAHQIKDMKSPQPKS